MLNAKPPFPRKPNSRWSPHPVVEIAKPAALDPLAITEADAPPQGVEDNWRTPPKIGGLSFAALAELIFTDPDKAASICQSTLKADHLCFWDSVYRVIALGMLWARVLANDAAAWAAFQEWQFWNGHSKLNRARVLSYCLMFLYGSHQGNRAHRANAHARQVRTEFDDKGFMPEDLPRQLYLRGGLNPKPVPLEEENTAVGTGKPAAVAAAIGRSPNGGEDVVTGHAESETNGAGRSKLPGAASPPSEDDDSLAVALYKYAQHLTFKSGQHLTIEVHVSIDEDSLEYCFEINHAIE